MKKRILAATLSVLLLTSPARAGSPVGVGGIVYDPSNWVQNYDQVVNSLQQISQLSSLIANGEATLTQVFQLVSLGAQTISTINVMKDDLVYVLSGRLFVDYYNQISGLFNSLQTATNGIVYGSNNISQVATTTEFSTGSETGQLIDSAVMNGQEGTAEQTNSQRLVSFVDDQINVQLPKMVEQETRIMNITAKMRCITDNLDSLPPEIRDLCTSTGLEQLNLPVLQQQFADNQNTLADLQSTSQTAEGQVASFSLQLENTQQSLGTVIQQAELTLSQYQTKLAMEEANLRVFEASLQRTARQEELYTLSVKLNEPDTIATEIARFYGP